MILDLACSLDLLVFLFVHQKEKWGEGKRRKKKEKKKEKEKKNIREISFSLFSLLFFFPSFLLFPTKDLTGISSNSFNESKECQRVSPRCTHTHARTHAHTHAQIHAHTHTDFESRRSHLSPLFLENFFRYIEPREPIDQLWWIVFCTDAISGSTRPETYEEGEWGRTDDSRRRSVNRNRRSSRKIIRVTNPPLESSGREPETEAWQQLGQLGQRLISFW